MTIRKIQYPDGGSYPLRGNVPSAPFKPGGEFSQSDNPSRVAVISAALVACMQVTSFEPQGRINSKTPQGWASESPVVLAKPFPAHEQQDSAYNRRGLIPTATTPQGWASQSPDVFVRGFNVAEQQFVAYNERGLIPTAATPQGWASQSPDIVVRGYGAALQQFAAFEPLGTITVVSNTIANIFSPSPDVFAKLFNASEQQFGAFSPRGAIFSTTPQGWASQSPDVFIRPYNVSEQQFGAFNPQGAIFSVTPQGWASESPIVLARPFNAAEQQFNAYNNLGNVSTAATPQGWASQSPDLFIKGFNSAEQQFAAYNNLGTVTIPTTPQGWASQSPDILIRSFNVSEQQFGAFAPLGNITPPVVIFNVGWASESPYILIRPFNVALQQDSAFTPGPVAASPPTTILGGVVRGEIAWGGYLTKEEIKRLREYQKRQYELRDARWAAEANTARATLRAAIDKVLVEKRFGQGDSEVDHLAVEGDAPRNTGGIGTQPIEAEAAVFESLATALPQILPGEISGLQRIVAELKAERQAFHESQRQAAVEAQKAEQDDEDQMFEMMLKADQDEHKAVAKQLTELLREFEKLIKTFT